MEQQAIRFYMLIGAVFGFIIIHLLFFDITPLLGGKSCPNVCYLTGWPFGSYEHKASLIVDPGRGTVTSVSAIGWLLNSIIGSLTGAGIGYLIGKHLFRKGQAISFPAAVPEKECLNGHRNGDGDQ